MPPYSPIPQRGYPKLSGGRTLVNSMHTAPSVSDCKQGGFPSAILAHSNVAIVPKETRYSFTQYAAGGLFRWVENGIQKSEDFYASLSEEAQEEQQLKDAVRWEFSLSLFPSASS